MSVKATINGRTFTLSWSEFEAALSRGTDCIEIHSFISKGGAHA